MANQEKVKAVLDAILEHPEHHDQNNWAKQTSCGTVMCIAGWACHLEGLQFQWDNYYGIMPEGRADSVVAEASDMLDSEEFVGDMAARILGLSDVEAYRLFHNTNNDSALTMLKHLADTGELPDEQMTSWTDPVTGVTTFTLGRSSLSFPDLRSDRG